ncbi:MAG: hypothetical protein OZ914_09955, partial [Anaerolineaceae bacterium]|nr:hypothetical protein [Anaerolineaceae bacterium]
MVTLYLRAGLPAGTSAVITVSFITIVGNAEPSNNTTAEPTKKPLPVIVIVVATSFVIEFSVIGDGLQGIVMARAER